MVVAAIEFLYPLVVLACPVGMLLMMWFMGRGMLMGKRSGETVSLPDLKAAKERLAVQIDALEATRTRQVRSDAEARSVAEGT